MDENTNIILNKLNKIKNMNEEIFYNLNEQNNLIDTNDKNIEKILYTTKSNIKIIEELL